MLKLTKVRRIAKWLMLSPPHLFSRQKLVCYVFGVVLAYSVELKSNSNSRKFHLLKITAPSPSYTSINDSSADDMIERSKQRSRPMRSSCYDIKMIEYKVR